MGERALLAYTGDTDGALALFEGLLRDPLPRQVDVVPGAESVLVRFSEPVKDLWVVRLGERAGAAPGSQPPGCGEVVIEVVYDGPDLHEVGERTGLGPDGVVTAHMGTPWRVAFCGFAPGFGYLSGGDPRLAVPRRDSPRPRIPAGSVGLAGEYTGVYPRASPGGWQLIGRTEAALWDARRDPPALLSPGMSVRFRAVRPTSVAGTTVPPSPATGAVSVPRSGRVLTVLRPGIQCTVQDLGRPGLAHLGVSPSGAADRGAAMRANRIVGNRIDAAVLEIVLGRAEFRFNDPTLIALTGAPVGVQVLDVPGAPTLEGASGPAGHDRQRPDVMDQPIALPARSRVRLGPAQRGLRSYLAVRGGIATAPQLGSRSSDLLGGIGGAPLGVGDVVPIGDSPWGVPHPVAGVSLPDPLTVELFAGPQVDWFAPDALERIAATTWTVDRSSDRVGVRLAPADGSTAPVRVITAELSAQGLVRGAMQIPPSGEPVIFLADHPVTGGYPVIALLTDAATDVVAQARPGATLRLRNTAGSD